MSNSIAYLIIILYWLFFYKRVLFQPFYYASSEALDCDFPTFHLCGEYWRRLKIPQDPYYFKYLIGSRTGTFYPLNIFFSWLSSFFGIDAAWRIYVFNIVLHGLLTTLFAYGLFSVYGNPLIALFGALAWGFAGYHIKFTLWWVQTFTWITATLWAFDAHHYTLCGISYGMLFLAGHPPLVLYFTYLFGGLCLVRGVFPLQTFLTTFAIGGYQIYAYWKYAKVSVRQLYTTEDKVAKGKTPLWMYLFTFIPFAYKDFIDGVEYTDYAYYVTPLVVFFCFFGIGHSWLLLIPAIILSLGGRTFKFLGRFMSRYPCRWGYFAMLAILLIGVNGLYNLELNNIQLVVIDVLLMILLLPNMSLIPNYPFNQWSKKPSEYFETSLLKYLEEFAKGFRVNNLPYPVYSGQINHIETLGYTGGNHLIENYYFLKLPKEGVAPYNWFDYNDDNVLVEKVRIKYHIGDRPSNNPKWEKVIGFDNLWKNNLL